MIDKYVCLGVCDGCGDIMNADHLNESEVTGRFVCDGCMGGEHDHVSMMDSFLLEEEHDGDFYDI